jgi:hypothetical protein
MLRLVTANENGTLSSFDMREWFKEGSQEAA